jgi:hypothetical protein
VARFAASFAFDLARGRAILYGGFDGAGMRADAWEFDGATWSPSAAAGPSAGYWNPMVYDVARHRAVLFLAYTGFTTPGQTWEYDVLAVPCAASTDCGTGACEEGLCCETACAVCETCAARGSPGSCTPVLGADDSDSCTGERTCDAAGACVAKP